MKILLEEECYKITVKIYKTTIWHSCTQPCHHFLIFLYPTTNNAMIKIIIILSLANTCNTVFFNQYVKALAEIWLWIVKNSKYEEFVSRGFESWWSKVHPGFRDILQTKGSNITRATCTSFLFIEISARLSKQ